jgi:hypothetical protein
MNPICLKMVRRLPLPRPVDGLSHRLLQVATGSRDLRHSDPKAAALTDLPGRPRIPAEEDSPEGVIGLAIAVVNNESNPCFRLDCGG